MSTEGKRILTVVEVLVVIFVVGMLIALLLVRLGNVRETNRRGACADNMRQLGLALHNFHDARKKFPAATNTPWGDDPALVRSGPWGAPEPASPAFDDTGDYRIDRGNGWSWMAMIKPYIEENCLYKLLRISDSGSPVAMPWNGTAGSGADDCRFTSACRTSIHSGKIDPGRQVPPWEQIPLFRCPSFSGGNTVDPPDGLDAYGPYDPSNPEHEPVAISNYACLGASHFPSLLKNPRLNAYEGSGKAGAGMHPNGIMYPGSQNGVRDIRDGTSFTVLLCETREEQYSAWFDGAVGCLVGLVSPSMGPSLDGPSADSFVRSPITGATHGDVVTTGANAVKTYLNYGDAYDKTGKKFYISYKTGNRIHGPSSEHPGIVNHLLADGTVKNIAEDIDPNIYFYLITRRGAEPAWDFD